MKNNQKLYWKSATNILPINRMSNSHIKSCLVTLNNLNNTIIGGFSKPFWELSFRRELEYRKALANAVVDEIPWLKEELTKVSLLQ